MVDVTPSARRLCVFARAPQAGRVKTRLARTLGEAAALAAHEDLVANTLSQVCARSGARSGAESRAVNSSASDYESELWITGCLEQPLVQAWAARHSLTLRRQTGSDLGARMAAALRQCLHEGNVGLVIGTDCPDIDLAYVTSGFAALTRTDLVIGPAEDGGYGLIGATRQAVDNLDAIFSGIAWSTPRVLAQTLERAESEQISVSLLKTIWDVDTAADWARYLAWKQAKKGLN